MTFSLTQLEAQPDLVERVHRALSEAIGSGRLAPLARIRQEDLARQLAVSRQPVLQALRLLKQQGLVLDAPGRGVQVAPLDATAIVQVYAVRGALDALAARLAAQRSARIDAGLIERGRAAAQGTDVQAMIDADIAFHRAVYAASGNPLIEQSAQVHWQHIRRAMGATLQQSGLRQTVWDEHEAIAEAIAAGHAVHAEQRMAAHAEQAGEHIARRLGAPPQETSDETDPRADRAVRP